MKVPEKLLGLMLGYPPRHYHVEPDFIGRAAGSKSAYEFQVLCMEVMIRAAALDAAALEAALSRRGA